MNCVHKLQYSHSLILSLSYSVLHYMKRSSSFRPMIQGICIYLYIYIILFIYKYLQLLLSLINKTTLCFLPFFVIALPPGQEPQVLQLLNQLNSYYSLSEQDPEWLIWVQEELNYRTPPARMAQRIFSFIHLEQTEMTRMELIGAFKHIYYIIRTESFFQSNLPF